MHPFTDTGLVVRTYDLGEADRIVTLLTERHGLVRAVARAVRRTRSRMGASLEPFAVVEVQIAPGRGSSGLGTVRQATSRESLARPLVADYPAYTSGCVVLETAERLAGEEGAPTPRLLRLAVGALRSLAEHRRAPGLVADAFLLRAMAASGWEPVLDCCVRCGAVGPHRAFHVASGGTVCVHCRPQGCAMLSPGVAEHLSALLSGRWDAVGLSSPAVVRQASGIAAAHLQWHLERDLRSLPLVDRGLVGADADGFVAARPDPARPDSARPADSDPVIPIEEHRARTTQIP
ncbi:MULTISPECIES: DNA repair protein RecO [Dietzia]|uniref:DNA repair protein RecO n=1 Tax=Dietzia TaxID=37914 RepID=UPI000D087173|nr:MULTISPECIES: DNA repair protein RecO [Dietzia]AVM64921.1 DNA repair protein RecO [Dietzia sp. oral taxon 368]MCT1711606.1 DNA repair protein RecO [Dietzia cinnamea]MCT1884110.1 DNA repair protein RecO [Dietzia cinnamea]MCT2120686.1 DNA repair protein RecO [Dietzia cinnamea]MCT2140355.1 DNA repair protein RecO [Dietzia cinnamea]